MSTLTGLRRFFRVATPSTAVTLLASFSTVVLLVIGSFVPGVYNFLDRTHIFQIIVLTLLCGIVYDIEIGKRSPAVRVFRSDYEAMVALDGFIRELPVRHVDILGAGLSTRYTLVARLAVEGTRVRVLIQNSNAAIDKHDGRRLNSMLIKLGDNVPEDSRANVEVVSYRNPATVRAVVLYGARRHCVNVQVLGIAAAVRGGRLRFGGGRGVAVVAERGFGDDPGL